MGTTEYVKVAGDLTQADLARLGFRPDPSWRGGMASWIVLSKGPVRVILQGEEGVDVYGFEGPGRVCAWEAHFGATTPAEIVTAAIVRATGG